MNDDSTARFPAPRYLDDGSWHGTATEEGAPASTSGGAAHRRRSRRRAVAPGRRRAATISAAAALVVAGLVGYGLLPSAHSGGDDAVRVPAMAAALPSAPSSPVSAPATATANASTSATAAATTPAGPSGSTPASAHASPGGAAPGATSPSASAGRNASTAHPTKPAGTADTGSRPGGTAAVTGAPPATGTAAQFAQQVADLTNVERAKAGCGPLTVNAQARTAAQVHSDDMVARHYFEHPDPEGHHADFRLRAAGYAFGSWGENIAYGQPTPADVVDEWMHSPPHRENILNCTFTAIGVGVNFGAGGPWWTQVFASPA